jgi:neurotransmitter:Na+ symporter, NSS family
MNANKKMTWVKESGFIFAMMGSAVGFANILAFSAQCYKNGGGAFLIPFFIAIFVIGLPMLFLEGAIGKKFNLPIASAYGKILPKTWKTFGWISALTCLSIGSFYTVLTSWAVAYTYFAALDKIPFDSAHFFQKEFLKDTGSIGDFGSVSWTILLSTLLVATFTWFINSKNISSGVEKFCSFFLPLLFILITTFSIIVAFLPGALDGFYYYLNPDFSKVLDFKLWRDVFGHVFFSFSLGIGIVVGYSRHTKQETNMKRAMILVALGDVAISIIAGFAIFGCVGYMSHETGLPFSEIVKSDSTFEMGFIIFPKILHIFAAWIRPVIGTIFFFCVFIAGITGVFSIVESVSGNIEVEFQLSRKQAVSISLVLMTLLSSLFCMGNSTHILGALTPMLMGYTFLLGGIAQIIAFMFMDKSLAKDNIFITRTKKTSLMFYIVKYFGLMFLLLSLAGALYEESLENFSAAHAVRWGWFFIIVCIAYLCSKKLSNLKKL